ncbi:MAG: F0F1 ATP synthase subunit A [Bacteroidota bacterium]
MFFPSGATVVDTLRTADSAAHPSQQARLNEIVGQAHQIGAGAHVGEEAHAADQGGGWILEHVVDSHSIDLEPIGHIMLPQFPAFDVFGVTVDLSITKHVVFLWIAAVLLVVLLGLSARGFRKRLVPTGFSNFIELIVVFIRDEVVFPTVGKEGLKMMNYFLTVFFFILTCNLLGLIPYGSTATGNVSVTAGLAIIAFLVIQLAGIRKNGLVRYFKGLIPSGIPIFVLPIMVVVELLGLFTKPFALCIRLFANMTAGHIVIFSLIGLIFTFETVLVAPISVGFALFINLLEILIAVVQAYIFTMLTALFVGLAVHQEH